LNDEGTLVAVIGLLENCETLIELVLVETIVTNVEVLVNVGVVDVTLDIVNIEPTDIDMSFIVLGMNETDWLIVVFVLNKDDIVDDTGKEELAIINDCEVISVSDSVNNKFELFKDVDIQLILVVYVEVSVLSFVAKIKEKWSVNIVVSYHIHSNCYQPYTFLLDIVLQRC
jgi:hypothetical protein